MGAAISLLSVFVFPLFLLTLFILAIIFSFKRKWKVVVRLGIVLGIILIFVGENIGIHRYAQAC